MAVVLIIESVNIIGPTSDQVIVQVITDIYMTCLQLPGCTSYSSQPAAANLCCCTPVCSLVPSPSRLPIWRVMYMYMYTKN